MQVQSKQTATVLMESLITMLVIAGLLVSINATYTSYTNLISAAKKNLALAECLEELGADGVANASQ